MNGVIFNGNIKIGLIKNILKNPIYNKLKNMGTMKNHNVWYKNVIGDTWKDGLFYFIKYYINCYPNMVTELHHFKISIVIVENISWGGTLNVKFGDHECHSTILKGGISFWIFIFSHPIIINFLICAYFSHPIFKHIFD